MKLYFMGKTIKEAGELKGKTFYNSEQKIEMPLETFEKLLDLDCDYVITTFNPRMYGKAGRGEVKSTILQWKVYGKNYQKDGVVYRRLY